MRNAMLSLCLLLMLPGLAAAQETPRAEIFGGYSYLRADTNDFPENDLHGWTASVNVNLNKWLGVKGDFSGHYNDYQISPGVKADLNLHFFTGGLQFTSYKNEKVTPYVHVLAGVARRTDSVSQALAANGRRTLTDNAFAFIVGGGMDVNINKSLAWRAFQTDYILTTFEDLRDDRQTNFRISTGLVWKLGEK
jgi:hypothetical protein